MADHERPACTVGLGKADITGPFAGIRFFGYAHLLQAGAGLEQRQFARAHIVRHGDQAIVFVNCDSGMISQLVRLRAMALVSERFGDRYPEECICLSATHTHSAPGGYSSYLLYNISITGHSRKQIDTIASGILRAIVRADASLQPGYVTLSAAPLVNASMNRSMGAYLNNPEEEREAHPYPFNERMVQLGFRRADNDGLLGVLNWFAVHGTSHDRNNRLVSGDNKGYAAWFVERHFGKGFVASFAQANSGDVSPNRVPTQDGRLIGEGRSCRESTEIIGRRQAEKSIQLTRSRDSVTLCGDLHSRWMYIDFANAEVPPAFSSTGVSTRTGPAILGQNFIAGTEDGRGPAWFEEGAERDLIISMVARLTSSVDEELERLHAPKNCFVRLWRPQGDWVPHTLPLQLLVIGPLAVVALPFEVTTLAGARLMKQAQESLRGTGVTEVVTACLANAYAGYLTTPEEYDKQHYEGASTLFGREQLNAVRTHIQQLAAAIVEKTAAPRGAVPPNPDRIRIFGRSLDKAPVDATLGLTWFGDPVDDCRAQYGLGETASATFWGAHPSNHPLLESSYFDVERLADGQWQVVATDHDWSTRFHWKRHRNRFSKWTCEWEVGQETPSGTYRLVHRGAWRSRLGRLRDYQGVSRAFEINRIAPLVDQEVSGAVVPGFMAGLPPPEVEAALEHFHARTAAPGEVVITEGAPDSSLFYVVGGRLLISKEGIEIDHAGPGELLGEIALFEQAPRSATVRCVEPGELMVLERAGYDVLWETENRVAYRIEERALELLGSRLRRLDFIIGEVAEAVSSRSRGKGPRTTTRERIRDLFRKPERTEMLSPRPLDPVELLEGSPLFAGVPRPYLHEIASWFGQISVPEGFLLCSQGETEDTIYILALGSVDVVVSASRPGGEERVEHLGFLTPGSAFGLTALMDGRPRMASCVTRERVDALTMDRKRWQACLAEPTRAASALRCAAIRALSGQIREALQHVVSLGWRGVDVSRGRVRLEHAGPIIQKDGSPGVS